jgi:histidinol-phosphate aminotransferase
VKSHAVSYISSAMTLRPRPEILDIHPYTPGISKIEGGGRVVKLSSNEGAFGVPPGVAEAVAAIAGEFHRYPDGSAAALRTAIGARFGLDPAQILCGAGSDDFLYLLCHIFGGPGTELIMTEHGFSIFDIAGRLAGCRVIKVPEHQRTTDVDAILAAVTPATRLVFVANPNNPTGTFIPTAETERLRSGLPEHVVLVMDAAYAEYVERPDYDPGIGLVQTTPNTVMTRTFSKIFGLGGLRLGWIFAPPAIIDLLNRARSPFNVSLAAHDAGLAALAATGWLETSRAHNNAERARMTKTLHDAGLPITPSETNFVLADLGSPARAAAANAFLLARGIIVRQVGGYGLPQCLRITVGLTEENDALIDALTTFSASGA